jgi:CDP-diglyceride synthetase
MKIHVFLLLAPLILSNITHMFIVKRDLFPGLKIPVSRNLFGENKTWRGFVLLSLLNAICVCLICIFTSMSLYKGFCLGAVLGFTYMLFELPNSYLKRSIGIEPGGKPKKRGWLFSILDKTDSSLGVCVVYAMLIGISFPAFCLLFLISILLHTFFSMLLFQFKVKKSF